MVFRLASLLFCLALLAAWGGPNMKKEMALYPLQALTSSPLVSDGGEIAAPDKDFYNWCDHWLPFLSEYTGALVDIETLAGQIRLQRKPLPTHMRIEGLNRKLKSAERHLACLPPAASLPKEHRDLLAANTVKARALLSAAQEIPPLLTILVEHPEDTGTAETLSNKIKSANEIFACQENVLKIRTAIILARNGSHTQK